MNSHLFLQSNYYSKSLRLDFFFFSQQITKGFKRIRIEIDNLCSMYEIGLPHAPPWPTGLEMTKLSN